jgi:hypothetical protein
MPVLHPPASDVVAADHPWAATLDLPPGTSCSLTLQLAAADGPAFAVSAIAESVADGGGQLALVLDVSALKAGAYGGQLLVDGCGEQTRFPVAFYRLPETPAPFPFGIYAVPIPETPAAQETTLQQLRAAGINLICQHLSGMGETTPFFDRAARYGIRFCPSDNLRLRDFPDAPDDWMAQIIGAEPDALGNFPWSDTQALCRHHPEVRAAAAEGLRTNLAAYQAHAAFSGLMYYGDDLFLRSSFSEGHTRLSCHCDYCRRVYAEETGAEPPITTEAARGVVAPDHPWLHWLRHRCEQQFGGLVRAIEDVRADVAPDVQLGLCHGWPDNPFVSIGTGIYGPTTQPMPVVSSYCYPFLRSPAQDFICHYEIGRMGNRTKDLWMLGVFGADRTMVPTWQVTQNYWNMLAAGYRFIAFFSWHDYAGVMAADQPAEHERAAAALAALTRCGEQNAWLLPLAAHWRPAPARAAALYSFTTEAFDIAPHHQGNRHSKAVCAFYREGLRQRVPLDVLCEEEVLAGIAADYEVICLHDVRALRADVQQALADFIAADGTVFCDPDPLYMDAWHPQAKVEIAGAVELAASSMVQALADRWPSAISVDSDDVTVRQQCAGAVDYWILVNNMPDRYWGMPYTYGDPERNHRHADLVRSGPIRTTVDIRRDGGGQLYDAVTGEHLGNTGEPLTLSLPAAWGRVIAVLPDEARLVLAAPETAVLGDRVSCELVMRNAAGEPVAGVFAVQMAVAEEGGAANAHSGPVSVVDGRARFALPLAANDMPGAWQITATGGFPRRSVTHQLRVAPGGAPAPAFDVCERPSTRPPPSL